MLYSMQSIRKSRTFAGLFTLVLLGFLLQPSYVRAVENPFACETRSPAADQKNPLSKSPSSPPQLKYKSPITPLGCQRTFTYQQEIRTIDSYHKQNGEQLRPILKDEPEAVSELNLYQRNRYNVEKAAYIGTIGLGIALVGLLISSRMEEPTSSTIRTAGLLGGLGIGAGTLIYSFSVLRTNETHLGLAVKNHNQLRPEDPIELNFSTGILF